MRLIVIAIGSALRRDDGAALAALALLRERRGGCWPPGVVTVRHDGEPLGLIELFAGAEAAVVLDATRSGASPGTIRRFDAGALPIASGILPTSSHGTGVGEALGLAQALGRLPRRTVVFGVEGSDFGTGEGLSDAVAAALPRLAEQVEAEVEALLDSGRADA